MAENSTNIQPAGADEDRLSAGAGMAAEAPGVDVAFITVNYNTRELLEQMVAFFRKEELPFSYSLTVVDNASGDGSLEFLATCPEVLTIKNDRNLGYGTAMNRGIAQSRARYLCLMNSDLILTPRALTALVAHCDSHPDVQVACPVIRYRNGRIQGFFFMFGLATLYFNLYKQLRNKFFKLRLARATEALPVDGIAGAFIFCRSGLARAGKLFDERFFFYYEDTELALRLHRQGARCEVLPGESIVHLGGGSSSLRHIQLFYAGRYLFVRLLYGVGHARAVFLQDLIRVVLKCAFYRVVLLLAPSDRVRNKRESYRHVAQTLKELCLQQLRGGGSSS
jgi:N-acetylglucosaminyl-diphospho-decaprenol L-rhamnosyltransferase